MSHELRTPLNAILGYSELLVDGIYGAVPEKAMGVLERVQNNGRHLLALINDVLDLSKIEAGRLDLENAPTDLAKLLVDLEYVLADAAGRKGLQLTLELHPDVPHSVVLDGRHLRQVLLNLLGNAVKFTAAGQVRLTIRRTEGWRLLFEFVDTGIGIEQAR
jgi:signal transduction histidine kinase